MLILKHEFNNLKLCIQSLTVQFVNKEDKIENTLENTDYGGKQINADTIAPEILLKCKMCYYSFKNNITLKKHMNTKHEVHNCDKFSGQFKTSLKLIKYMAECQERG